MRHPVVYRPVGPASLPVQRLWLGGHDLLRRDAVVGKQAAGWLSNSGLTQRPATYVWLAGYLALRPDHRNTSEE